jgi:D-alanyl-D-alanine carboxypeptidase
VTIASGAKMSGNVRTGEWGIKVSQKASGLRGSGRVALSLVGVFAVTTIAVLPADAKHYRANVTSHERDRERDHASSSSSPAYAAIVVDGNSGTVLHSANPDELRHPASLTKIMTLYLLFERLDAGKIKLDTQIPVSEHAAGQAPTKLGLKPGHTIAVEDAIKGLVTKSANDAAVVVAEALGGSEGDFAEMMTRKAHALGMSHTIYRNASGLPNDEQVTTAREQALLGRAVQERFPRYYRYFSTSSFTYHGETMSNHNHLLGRVEGVDGIKTGYTQASGFNLVTSVHRNNRHIVAVVLGGSSAGARDAKMRSLIEEHIVRASTQHSAPLIAESAVAMPVTRTAEARTDTKVRAAQPQVADGAAARPNTPSAESQTDVKTKTYEVASAPPQQHWPASKFAATADEPESAPAPVRTKAAPTKPASAAADDTIKPIPVKTIKVKLAQTQTSGLGLVTADASPSVDAAAPFKGRSAAPVPVAAAPEDTAPVTAAPLAAAPAAQAAPIDLTPAAPTQAAPIAPTAVTAKAAAPEEAAVIAPAQSVPTQANPMPAEPPVAAAPAKAPRKAPAAKTGGMMLAAAAPPVLIAAPPAAEVAPAPVAAAPAPVAAAPVSAATIVAALTSRPAPAAAKPQAAAPGVTASVPTPVSAAPAAKTVIAAAAPAPAAATPITANPVTANPITAAPATATAIAAAPATTTVIAAAAPSQPVAEPVSAPKPVKPSVVASMTLNETPAPAAPVTAAPETDTAPSFPAVQAFKPAAKPKTAPVVEASAASDAKTRAARAAGWVIQVGAFDAEHDAQQRLTKAQAKIGHVLDRADPFTEPVLKGEKTLYRARFAGFQQKDEAEAVCKQLKRNDIDCMTIKN